MFHCRERGIRTHKDLCLLSAQRMMRVRTYYGTRVRGAECKAREEQSVRFSGAHSAAGTMLLAVCACVCVCVCVGRGGNRGKARLGTGLVCSGAQVRLGALNGTGQVHTKQETDAVNG
jgi:hypothetical protein